MSREHQSPSQRATPQKARRSKGWVALTGTPGTGKSSVAKRLPPDLPAVEVQELALQLGAGRRWGRRSVEVDLAALRRAFRRFARTTPTGVVVGHLAHFLPVRYVIVLRCHPRELDRRLRKARRSARDRGANVLSEALDIVLVEALASGAPVREVDTTRRSITGVARIVAGLVRRRPAASYGRVRWLADRRLTEELLRGTF
jgi:adenylate kinase